MGDWTNGLLGCFSNCGLCLMTYFAPCITMGRNAGALGDSCCLHTCFFFIPVLNVIIRVSQRGRIRERQGIDGGVGKDILLVLCCPFCSLQQEAQELKEMDGGMAMDMARE